MTLFTSWRGITRYLIHLAGLDAPVLGCWEAGWAFWCGCWEAGGPSGTRGGAGRLAGPPGTGFWGGWRAFPVRGRWGAGWPSWCFLSLDWRIARPDGGGIMLVSRGPREAPARRRSGPGLVSLARGMRLGQARIGLVSLARGRGRTGLGSDSYPWRGVWG